MRITRRLVNPGTIRKLETLSQDIARRSSDAVLGRLGDHVMDMSKHEKRGYVRSRAAAVIQRETAVALSQRPSLPRWAHRELVQQSTDQVVLLAMRDLSARRTTPTVVRRAG